jgi:hypothetical protein
MFKGRIDRYDTEEICASDAFVYTLRDHVSTGPQSLCAIITHSCKCLLVGTLPSLILRLVHGLDLAQRRKHGGSVDQLKAIQLGTSIALSP